MNENEYSEKLAKLSALRADFVAALPDRISALAAGWRAVQAAGSWENDHAELTRLVHSIVGSAGTFGYHRLGEVARELEQLLVWLSQAPDGLFSPKKTRVDDLIGIMGNLVLSKEAIYWGLSADIATNGTYDNNNHRVVLIEDDAFVAEDLATQLRMFGWEVNAFCNATDALSAMTESEPPAVIIDVMLPEGPMAGIELIQQFQSRRHITIPHVVLSSRNDWESRLAAARTGAAAYLVKPVDISALEEHLDRITSHRSPEPYRVLVVDDDSLLAEYYAGILSAAGMDVIAISEPCKLLFAIAEHRPEIILMDIYMPECSGIEALKVIRQDSQFDSLPVVFLSTESDRSQQQSAIRTGAEDFLQKPVSELDLIVTVSVRTERFRSLNKLIRQDSLTGLLNHIAFKLRLEAEIDRSLRSHELLSVAMLDIDNFKHINDTHGHPQGDRVIKSLAQLLHKRLRKSDIIGRYGGEEFVIAMPTTSPSLAVTIMDELRDMFGKLRFETSQGEFVCTFSGGVSSIPPQVSPIKLIKQADEALYQAKNMGRNRIELYKTTEPGMP